MYSSPIEMFGRKVVCNSEIKTKAVAYTKESSLNEYIMFDLYMKPIHESFCCRDQ